VTAPNKSDLLRARLHTTLAEVRRTEDSLERALISERLRKRVGARFDRLLSARERALAGLLRDLDDGVDLEQCWIAYRDVQSGAAPLYRECLAFLEGALARRDGLDEGLCEIADHLLEMLSRLSDARWERFTLLADGEFYGEMAEIIRLRFPEVSVWNLPVAAHEFGHFVGPTITAFDDMLEAEGPKRSESWLHLHEQFADVFAVYSLGPSYAFTCLLLRFDPTIDEDDESHPAPAKRAHLVLRALARLSEGKSITRPFRDFTELLESTWRGAREAAGRSPDFAADEIAALDDRLDTLFELIASNLPSRLRYSGSAWLRAQRLADELVDHRDDSKLERDDTILDVLNAAWIARVMTASGDAATVRELGATAMRWCEAIVTRDERVAARAAR
jgi:hypothetical protein